MEDGQRRCPPTHQPTQQETREAAFRVVLVPVARSGTRVSCHPAFTRNLKDSETVPFLQGHCILNRTAEKPVERMSVNGSISSLVTSGQRTMQGWGTSLHTSPPQLGTGFCGKTSLLPHCSMFPNSQCSRLTFHLTTTPLALEAGKNSLCCLGHSSFSPWASVSPI